MNWFLKHDVAPLLGERENEIAIYQSPISFKNAKARNKLHTYVNHIKCMEEIPEKEREKLKGMIDEDS
jgi:hypothetical protein